MKTIYLLRHQFHGLVTSHAFAEKPTDKQLAPILAELEQRHKPAFLIGDLAELHKAELPVDGAPWIALIAVPCCEAEDVPTVTLHGGPKGPASGAGRVD